MGKTYVNNIKSWPRFFYFFFTYLFSLGSFLKLFAFIRKIQCFIPPFLEERTSLRKDAPKQANYEELANDEKTTIYTKTALVQITARATERI
jgi:hypothetical protein